MKKWTLVEEKIYRTPIVETGINSSRRIFTTWVPNNIKNTKIITHYNFQSSFDPKKNKNYITFALKTKTKKQNTTITSKLRESQTNSNNGFWHLEAVWVWNVVGMVVYKVILISWGSSVYTVYILVRHSINLTRSSST